MQPRRTRRLLRALAREGLEVSVSDGVYTVRLREEEQATSAQILLPESLEVEGKAFLQLARLAAVVDPGGGRVCRACATPDFHPGNSGIAIGSVVQSNDLVIPAAVGGDINCGMRLHRIDLSLDDFLAQRDRFVRAMTGDYFLGTRDVVMGATTARALFADGLMGWLTEARKEPLGMMRRVDWEQMWAEAERVFSAGSMAGDPRWAPDGLLPQRGIVRDGGLATIGGGNHFVEVVSVDEILDRRAAWRIGIVDGGLMFMVHSGSRHVGRSIGDRWRRLSQRAWPVGRPHPRGGLFSLSRSRTPKLVDDYLQAEATAANYGFVNRALLAECLRQRLRAIHGDIAVPLICDLPHNITLPEGDGWVSRKGACPAPEGQTLVIPGSMGTPSYVAVGLGNERFLSSASHGAGRARSRFEMGRRGAESRPGALGLDGVDCVTLRPERRIEEAPAAYKPIEPVIDAQVDAGLISVVARLRPVLTFKA